MKEKLSELYLEVTSNSKYNIMENVFIQYFKQVQWAKQHETV